MGDVWGGGLSAIVGWFGGNGGAYMGPRKERVGSIVVTRYETSLMDWSGGVTGWECCGLDVYADL